jgi:hypothetical protein
MSCQLWKTFDTDSGHCARQNKRLAFGSWKCRDDGKSESVTGRYTLRILLCHYRMKITYAISTETHFEAYAWDTFFLAPMNAGCLAFIVQTSDLKLIVRTFARLAHSTRATHRANRMYLILPSVGLPENVFEANIKELYHMRQMGFMPDLVIAKFVTEQNMTRDDFNSGESHMNILHTNSMYYGHLSLLCTVVTICNTLHFAQRLCLPVSYDSHNNSGLQRDSLSLFLFQSANFRKNIWFCIIKLRKLHILGNQFVRRHVQPLKSIWATMLSSTRSQPQ